jgi:hypothetical protein
LINYQNHDEKEGILRAAGLLASAVSEAPTSDL